MRKKSVWDGNDYDDVMEQNKINIVKVISFRSIVYKQMYRIKDGKGHSCLRTTLVPVSRKTSDEMTVKDLTYHP